MNSEEALREINDMANVIITEIPERIEIDGREYEIKRDITHGNREYMLIKYQNLYQKIRDRIREMDDVPEEMVKVALILHRTVIFLKDFRDTDEMEDKKRWMDYIKRVRV